MVPSSAAARIPPNGVLRNVSAVKPSAASDEIASLFSGIGRKMTFLHEEKENRTSRERKSANTPPHG